MTLGDTTDRTPCESIGCPNPRRINSAYCSGHTCSKLGCTNYAGTQSRCSDHRRYSII